MSAAHRPTAEALVAGDRQLEVELRGLRDHLLATVETLDARLRDGLSEPLAHALEAARDAHARLISESGLDGDAAGAEADRPSWAQLRAYRDGVAAQVLAPLLDALREAPPGPRVPGLWGGFLEGIAGAAEGLPEEIRRTEPEDLFAPDPQDSLARSLRKVLVRSGRRAAGWVRPEPVREQRVPLREIAAEVLRGEALPGAADRLAALNLHFAGTLLVLDAALARWTGAWFPIEDLAPAGEEHLGPSAEARLVAYRAAVRTEEEELKEELRSETASGGESSGEPEVESEPDFGPGAGPGAASEATPADGTPGHGEPAYDAAPEADAGDQAGHGENRDTVTPATPASVARDLQAALASAAEQLRHPAAIVDGARDALDALRGDFERWVHDADSPVARSRGRAQRRRLRRAADDLAELGEGWAEWFRAVEGRVHLTLAFTRLRGDVDRCVDGFLEGVLAASVLALDDAVRGAAWALESLRSRAVDPASPLQTAMDAEAAARACEGLQSDAEEILRTRVLDVLGQDSMESRVREAADHVTEAIIEGLRTLPEAVEVHVVREGATRARVEQPVRSVKLQELMRQSLDALQLESLRTSPSVLLAALDEVRVMAGDVPRVVEYNLGAAQQELRQLISEKSDDAPEAVLADARSLTLHGLERAVNGVERLRGLLLPPWEQFVASSTSLPRRALSQVHARVALEGAVQEQFHDLRTRLRRLWRRAVGEVRSRWSDLRRRLEPVLRRGHKLVQALVRRGKMAVGAAPTWEGEAERAMEVMRNIPGLMQTLPLVYRRLFSFRPVTDPSLLAGREEETEWVARRYATWKEGLRTPSVVIGPISAGQTSFFNVLASSVFRDARVVRMSLERRYRSEETLAQELAEVFRRAGILAVTEGPWSLQRLAGLLMDQPPEPAPPTVVLVEHLPHLYLRVPGGTALVVRFMDFMARTSPSIFWLTGASGSMWKHVQKTEPRAVALAATTTLSVLTRGEMESALMARHRRSGVPLEFVQPPDANPLLRRRLQRARSSGERQEILRAEFFERLHRASQGNMAMAILLWLMSADFFTREGRLRLGAPRAIRFTFLDELDIGLDFALMAFLEHGSLTLEEYSAVFAVPQDEAYQAMEALRGRTLLDRLDTQGGLPEAPARIQDGVRYRVPPLLTQVISEYLRNQNILH